MDAYIVVHREALETLVAAFRSARQTEFRHLVEQLNYRTISTKDLLDMRAKFQEETERYISALYLYEETK